MVAAFPRPSDQYPRFRSSADHQVLKHHPLLERLVLRKNFISCSGSPAPRRIDMALPPPSPLETPVNPAIPPASQSVENFAFSCSPYHFTVPRSQPHNFSYLLPSYNTQAGAIALAGAMIRWPELKSLDLESNRIGDTGAPTPLSPRNGCPCLHVPPLRLTTG